MDLQRSRRTLGAVGFAACVFSFGTSPKEARAECHFKVPTAIVCTDPRNAAMAYKEFGLDAEKTNKSYNRQILRESLCSPAYETNYQTVKVKLNSAGRVATASGWVAVSAVTVEHDGIDDLFYTASEYLRGTCEKYTYAPKSEPPKSSPYLPSYPSGGYTIQRQYGVPGG
jgi:hypothetical protein